MRFTMKRTSSLVFSGTLYITGIVSAPIISKDTLNMLDELDKYVIFMIRTEGLKNRQVFIKNNVMVLFTDDIWRQIQSDRWERL